MEISFEHFKYDQISSVILDHLNLSDVFHSLAADSNDLLVSMNDCMFTCYKISAKAVYYV